jgi:hypothetical protein
MRMRTAHTVQWYLPACRNPWTEWAVETQQLHEDRRQVAGDENRSRLDAPVLSWSGRDTKKGDNSGIKEIFPGYCKSVPSPCENL